MSCFRCYSFAPTCSSALLRALGQIAKDTNSHVQTHMSEQIEEVRCRLIKSALFVRILASDGRYFS